MPNLIEVQKTSYDKFLQMDVVAEERESSGLQEVFKSVFPIKDFSERGTLEFVKYEFEEPKYDVEECQQRGITFAAPLKVTLRLVVWDIDGGRGSWERKRGRIKERKRGKKRGREVKEEGDEKGKVEEEERGEEKRKRKEEKEKKVRVKVAKKKEK